MNTNQRIADMAVQVCEENPYINPLTAIFMAMQALDPKPGAKIVVDCASHAKEE